MKYTTTALSAGVLAVLPCLGAAQEDQDIFDAGEITVTGNLTPQSVNRTGATVEVLDQDALAQEGETNLAQTLDRLPGVSFSANGGLGATTTLRIRGLDSKYIGVRIDGIDVSDPSSTQTQFNFGGLSAGSFGRVEVLKGSQSALYGSEAIAGVVDLTTAQSDQLGFSGRLIAEAGSNETRNGSLNLSQVGERGEIALTLSRTTTDGFSTRATSAADDDDGFHQTFVSLSGKHALGDSLTLGASAFYREAKLEIDQSTTDPDGQYDRNARGARAFAELDAFGLTHTLAYAQYINDRHDSTANPAWGQSADFEGRRNQLSYQGATDLGLNGTLVFGLDKTFEKFETTFDQGEVDTSSAYGELQYALSNTFDVALSLRRDDHSDFGVSTSGRVSAAWNLPRDVTLRAVYGTGFRAPSLYERFSPYGVADLEMEESETFELGVEKRYGARAFVKLTAFRTNIDNLIQFDGAATACGSGFGCYNQVEGTTVTEGYEVSGRYALNDQIAVSGNYTRTDAETDDIRLVRVPRHDFTLGLDAQITDRLSADLSYQAVRDIKASAFAPDENDVNDYNLTHLGMTYALNDDLQGYIRVENLFDEEYETAGGFNTPDRSVFVGIRAAF